MSNYQQQRERLRRLVGVATPGEWKAQAQFDAKGTSYMYRAH